MGEERWNGKMESVLDPRETHIDLPFMAMQGRADMGEPGHYTLYAWLGNIV